MLYQPLDKPSFIEYLDSSIKERNISNIQKCYLMSGFNSNLFSGNKMLPNKQFYDSYSQAPVLVKKIYRPLLLSLPTSIDPANEPTKSYTPHFNKLCRKSDSEWCY